MSDLADVSQKKTVTKTEQKNKTASGSLSIKLKPSNGTSSGVKKNPTSGSSSSKESSKAGSSGVSLVSVKQWAISDFADVSQKKTVPKTEQKNKTASGSLSIKLKPSNGTSSGVKKNPTSGSSSSKESSKTGTKSGSSGVSLTINKKSTIDVFADDYRIRR